MKKNITVIILMACVSSIFAQINTLKGDIEQYLLTKQAKVGVAISSLEGNDAMSINGDEHLPMQSVYKFHIALAVLNEVDRGKLAPNEKVFVSKEDLHENTWSPLRDTYPQGNLKLPIAEILQYTVAWSDNNGCDILLKLIGGTPVVDKYFKKIEIKDISIKATEHEMHQAWDVQFTNWTTPKATNDILEKFFGRKILSKKSHQFLKQVLIETTTGKNRIKGLLPDGTVVAHKTGTSGKNEQGIMAAVNDIGIVTLPNGKHFAISIFVTNSKESLEVNERIIADISKMAWDYFNR